jgi:hypothetical protein
MERAIGLLSFSLITIRFIFDAERIVVTDLEVKLASISERSFLLLENAAAVNSTLLLINVGVVVNLLDRRILNFNQTALMESWLYNLLHVLDLNDLLLVNSGGEGSCKCVE